MTSPSNRVIGLYERNALAWDEARRRGRHQGERDWIERFSSIVASVPSVLDLGCGSGDPVGHDLLAAGFDVTGVDSSPSLIAMCRERYPEASWIVEDMRELQLDRRFGGVLAWHSLFHLTEADQEQMFAVFEEHAAPGAVLMFSTGPERGETIGSWQGEPLCHASLDRADYEALLDRHGFSLVSHVEEDASCGGATVWLAKAANEG